MNKPCILNIPGDSISLSCFIRILDAIAHDVL